MPVSSTQDYRRVRSALRFVSDEPHVGNHWFVYSSTGSDSTGRGGTPDAPTATLDYAVGLCSAGDTIHILPGHNEGLGNAQITLDVEGITIIGHGRGSKRPRIDFDHANASIDVAASGITIKNLVLLPSVTAVLIGIDVNTTVVDTTIEDVEVLPGEDGAGVDEFVLAVDIKASCSRTVIRRLKIRQHASSANCNAGVSLTDASDDVTVADSDIVVLGTDAVAPIKGITTLSTNVRLVNNILVSDNEPGIELLTGTTGVIRNNLIFSDLATIAAAIVADGCALDNNKYVEVGGESGATIGTASVDD